jgi:hypothetical protein
VLARNQELQIIFVSPETTPLIVVSSETARPSQAADSHDKARGGAMAQPAHPEVEAEGRVASHCDLKDS